MGLDLGRPIQRLLKMHPLCTLDEGAQMIVAGQLAGEMQDVARRAVREMPYVAVHVYEHPTWDMKLILAADPNSREQALENIGGSDDAASLVCTLSAMPRAEFEALPEWDG